MNTILKFSRFHTTFWVALAGVVLVVLYIACKFIYFHLQLIEESTPLLTQFSHRSIARLEANPHKFTNETSIILGNQKMKFIVGKDNLKSLYATIKNTSDLKENRINLLFGSINSLTSIIDFSIIYPVYYKNQYYYSLVNFKHGYNDEYIEGELTQSLIPVIFTSATIIALLFFVQFFYTYRINNNVRELATWAQNLSLHHQPQSPPQMAVKGLNPLAVMMNSSLQSFSNILEKEHSFARYTSHELRTQIAILSANMEILEAIMTDLNPSERKVLYRMEQAVSDMKYQTEALLWISKEIEHELVFDDCLLLTIVKKTLADNHNLFEGKNITVNIVGQENNVKSHPILLQIILNNLIRNALQNTSTGEVTITITPDGIEVFNKEYYDEKYQQVNDGFGIGLVIVEKIVERLKIEYLVESLTNGRKVTITL
jgi:signal transduction histidine kinase